MDQSKHSTPVSQPTSELARRPWISPAIRELPRLTDLTLDTGMGIPGSGSGGSTVFG